MVAWRTYQRLMEKGTESKITKIIGELNKASKTHKGQADRLTTILSVLKGANKDG